MPGPEITEPVIGADPSVALPLVDPTGHASRRHARLIRLEGKPNWKIEDLHSRYGTQRDGDRVAGRVRIVPGMEIGIGGITLVAENATLIGLRGYLARVLGWTAASRLAIDLAMRAIRAAARRRAELMLAGPDDLVAVARQIHVRTHGPDAPFVVCGRVREPDASVRVTATIEDATTALQGATGGTVCVRADELPTGYDGLVEASSDPLAPAQLTLCARKASQRGDLVARPIVIPRLVQRSAEDLDRIVTEYAFDAIREFGASPGSFTDAQRQWVIRKQARTWADIEIATLRLVARAASGNIHQAAARIGMTHAGLGKWFERRGLPR